MANWKKIIVSGSNAELSNITASAGLLLPKIASQSHQSSIQTPLVIDKDGNVSTGSAYALASGGNTVGGSNLVSNIALIGAGSSLIQTASSVQNVDFNTADLKNITELTASKAIFDTIALSGSSPQGSGSSANLFNISFSSTESAALTIPSTTLNSIDFKVPVTMSNVPGGSSETKVLLLDNNGRVVTRSNSDLGGVTSVNANTNISMENSNTTGDVVVQMDSNLTGLNSVNLNHLTSSEGIFFTSSKNVSTEGPKLYKIDYAKVRDGQDNLIPESGSLQITASGLKVEGDIDGDGNITLDGTLSFNGFNFVESSVSVTSGSTQFGSGSTGSDIPLTTHQFTGSVLITGSNLALDGGILSIPGYANVATTLGTFLTVDEGGEGAGTGISTSTFRAFSQSISSSLDSLNDLVIGAGPNSSSLMNFSQSISSSFDLLNDLVIGVASNSSSLMNFSSSVSTSLDLISSSIFTSNSGILHFTGSAITIFNTIGNVTSSLHTFTSSVSTSLGALDTFTSSLINAVSFSGTNTFAQGNLNVAGNLIVEGTTTTFNVQDLSIEDRFIVIGSGSSQVDNNIDVGIIFETGSFDGVDTTARGMALYFDNSRNRLAVGKHINNVDFTASFDGGQSAFNVGQKGFRAGNMVTVKSTFIEGKNLSTEIGNDTKSASFGTGEIIIDTNEDIWFYVGADHDDEFPGD